MDTYALKKRIIEYAIPELLQKGIDGFRVDDISSALGISKKTFYEVFESKSTMVKTCILQVVDGCKKRLEVLIETDGLHPVRRFQKLIEMYINFLYANGKQSHSEFLRKYDFSEERKQVRKLWHDAFDRMMSICQPYLLTPSVNGNFLDIYLPFFEEARVNEDQYEKTLNGARLLTRGLFNADGMTEFDRHFQPNGM